MTVVCPLIPCDEINSIYIFFILFLIDKDRSNSLLTSIHALHVFVVCWNVQLHTNMLKPECSHY